ncbi:hypothetical protein ACHAXR_008810 [Thalassiosira sp. AJA248-18]
MVRHLPPYFLAALALSLSNACAFTTPNHHGSISSQKRSMALSVKRQPIMMPTQEPMVPYRAPGSAYDQFIGLQSRQLRDRKLWIARYIDEEASNSIISSLLYLQSESDKEDIKLYLNIPGANLRPALAIYDAVSELKADGCKIATTNIALCAGMGALLAGAGTKGMRYSLPNARYLLQKTGMDQVFQGQASDIALEVRNVKKWNEKINGEISKVTGQSMERIDQDLKRDFYLSSEEAVRYGLIDEVLLPMPNKRQPASGFVDLGSFQSGEEQKYQGENPPEQQQQQQEPGNKGMMRTNDDDDDPKIAKA